MGQARTRRQTRLLVSLTQSQSHRPLNNCVQLQLHCPSTLLASILLLIRPGAHFIVWSHIVTSHNLSLPLVSSRLLSPSHTSPAWSRTGKQINKNTRKRDKGMASSATRSYGAVDGGQSRTPSPTYQDTPTTLMSQYLTPTPGRKVTCPHSQLLHRKPRRCSFTHTYIHTAGLLHTIKSTLH